MPHSCCVPKCTNYSSKPDCIGLPFHSFPSEKKQRKAWIVKCRRDTGKSFKITKETRVCGAHFTREDYPVTAEYAKKKYLLKCAVPSIFEWSVGKETRKPPKKSPRAPQLREGFIDMTAPGCSTSVHHHEYAKTKRKARCIQHVKLADDSTTEASTADEQEDTIPETHSCPSQQVASSSDSSILSSECDTPCKADVQKKYNNLLSIRNTEKFSMLRFVNNDTDIRYYTGFPSYQALKCFYEFLQPACNYLYYVGTDNSSSDKQWHELKRNGPPRSLSPMEELFLVLVRLRKGLDEKLIADLYSLNPSTISRTCNTWISFLFEVLTNLPIWPTQDFVNTNARSCFKEHFPKTRVVLDCTELFIETPSASYAQRETFSSYKHHNTAKGLLGLSPTGYVSFISPLYAGRTSDKKLVRNCGILDMLEPGDGLMVDRGFDLHEDCKQRNIELYVPPAGVKTQFNEEELKTTRQVAAVRVHVERAIRNVRQFEILRGNIRIGLCPMLDKIWVVCAHLSNFTGSLFRDT